MQFRLNNIVNRKFDANVIKRIDLEKIYGVVCLVYIYIYFFTKSDFLDLSFVIERSRGVIAVLAIFHLFYVAAKNGISNYLIADVSFLIVYAKILAICYSNVPGYVDGLCNTWILGFCVLGIDYRKVLRSALLSYITSILLGFLCSFTSIVDLASREYQRSYNDTTTTIIRSGWGYRHENGLGTVCFMAIACFCIGFSHFSKVLKSLIAFAVALFVWIIPNSRFNAYLIVLMGLALLIDYLLEKLILKKQIFYVARKCIEILALLVAIAIPFFFIAIILNYDKVNPVLLSRLDNLASGRISLAHSGYIAKGFSIWGQYYDRGAYLDSSWIRIPIMWGLPMFAFIIVCMIYLGIKAYKNDDFLLIVTILLISISGICYELISMPDYNVFLFLPFAWSIDEKIDKVRVDTRFAGKVKKALYQNAALISVFVATILFIIFRKNIVSTLQTFIECKGLDNNASITLILVLIALSFVTILSFSGCIKAIALPHTPLASMSLLFASCIILFSAFIFEKSTISSIDEASLAFDEVIADQEAMSILASIEGVEIVPQIKPLLYKDYYDFTDLKWLPTADYARFDNITVIVAARDNYRTFSNTGFVQTPISDYHKIYTNDSRVIEAMVDAGYRFTSYSQYVKELDLDQYAEINGLNQAPDGSVLVKASQNGTAITNKLSEDFADIYYDEKKALDEDGDYNLHIVLKADANDLANMNQDDVVAHVLLTANSGTFIDYRITASEFDDGLAICDIPFTMWKFDGKRIYTAFSIDEVYNLDFAIEEMSYWRQQ